MSAELTTQYAVRYRDTATVFMSGEIAYHYVPMANRVHAEEGLDLVKRRGQHGDRDDAVIVEREVSEWRVSE